MKRLVLSVVAAGLLSTNAIANECATISEKIGFGAIGIVQGAVIGGPIGALWGLGTIIYADKANGCEDKDLQITKAATKTEKTITLLVQNGSMDQDKEEKNTEVEKTTKTLDEIKTLKNPEPVQTYKEVNSFVNFAYDKYDFKTTNTELSTLNMSNATKVEIEGHTDSKGTDEYNFALGLKRANSVKAYLIKNNIPKNIVSVKSFGEAVPISNVDASNRRVDLKITYK